MLRRLVASIGKLDDADIAKLDALAVRAVGKDEDISALVGYPDAEALQGAIVVDYLLSRAQASKVRDGSIGERDYGHFQSRYSLAEYKA